MGMILGGACVLCWDHNCNCTPEEINAYRAKQKLFAQGSLKYSDTNPKVVEGDIIIKSNTQYFVYLNPEGIFMTTELINQRGAGKDFQLEEPYIVFKSITQI